MGKSRKGFNWKARQVSSDAQDDVPKCKVEVQIDGVDTSLGYGDTNALVLPTHSQKKKKKEQPAKKVKRLTKKERKKLENVLVQKQKKLKRADILTSLAEHQASKEELQSFLSISEVQTGKTKRKPEPENTSCSKINTVSVKKVKKQKRDEQLQESSEGEESVNTSDMSTDDEEDVNNNDDDDAAADDDIVVVEGEQLKSETSTNNEACVSVKSEPEDDHRSSSSSGQKTHSEENSAGNKAVSVKGIKTENIVKKATHVPVSRTEEIQNGRLKLPILGEEQVIMEAIHENPVVIICGETGSGKTTQVPQFLYEAGYAQSNGIIAITEPRRVAAISMSKRVAKEMALTSREVSYQIRYEGNVTDDTKIKFMTDGVLLKEVQQDFLLTKYSAVVIDEAHERSTYTDILIGLLSRIVPLRHKKGNPLKLIIMSATLRVEDFTENKVLFKVTPPVIKVDARQFPVTIHYNKRTPLDNYLDETFKKVCKIHRMLPDGGILVFVTGQQEVHTLCRKLKQTYPVSKGTEEGSQDKPGSSKKDKRKKKKRSLSESQKSLPKINLDNYSVTPSDAFESKEQKHYDPDISDDDLEIGDLDIDLDVDSLHGDTEGCDQPLYVLPLYSLLSSEKQALVFGPVPEGCRLCVVATNVAETSLTIPDIKYVVDTGKTKTKLYDKVTGVSKFEVTWTSKASANQRAGRAGRVGPGHCYRLYSSAVFNDEFTKFTPAEITRRPVDDLVLQMKAMNIDKVVNFPYPTPPALEQIQAAETILVNLGAISSDKGKKEKTITPLGKTMSCFPISPRYAKMLAIGHQQNLLPYVIAIVSALSVQELFIEVYSNPQDESQKEEFKKRLQTLSGIKRRWAGSGNSQLLGDLMVMLKAIGACEYEGGTAKFCEDHGIRLKAMKEVRKLRMQLTNTVNTVVPDTNICIDPKLSPPDDIQAKLLRQIVLAGMGDHVARKLPENSLGDENAKKFKRAYQCQEVAEPVFIHPSSVLYKDCPEFVVYQHIEETSKLYMKGIVAVESDWFPVFCPTYVTLSKPLEDPPPDYDELKQQVICHMTGTFGRCCWKIKALPLEYPTGIDKMKWFARFLLEGRVIKGFKKFTSELLSSPSTMVKSWAKLQPRTETLLRELVNEGIDDRDSLIRQWKKQPDYLLNAIKEWLPESRHSELCVDWPPP